MNKKIVLAVVLGCMMLLATAQVGLAAVPVTVTKTVDPTTINKLGSGINPELTTVTITVTGSGGIQQGKPLDVVFAIDSTGSMSSSDPNNLRKAAAISFLNKMDSSRDQAGVVNWDTAIQQQAGLTNDFAQVAAVINQGTAGGNTNGNLGLTTALAQLTADTRPSTDVQKVIIFLTDGQFNTGGDSFSQANINQCIAAGVTVFTIGLGNAVNTGTLQAIATQTGGQYFSAPTADNLQEIFDAIYSTINTAPKNVDVNEVTASNIVLQAGTFSITPTTATDHNFVWNNIAASVGNGDNYLEAGEVWTVTFQVGSNTAGTDLPVQASGAQVSATVAGQTGPIADIPQAYITVNENHPPVAVASIVGDGVAQSVHLGTTVKLDGTQSYDPDNDPLTYTWSIFSAPSGSTASLSDVHAAQPQLTGVNKVGDYVIQLVVNDGHVNSNIAQVTITGTNDAPVVSGAVASVPCLWPPDHKFVLESITGVNDPNGDKFTIAITGITSDEPMATIVGAGGAVKHVPDAIISAAKDTAQLRAERSGTGDGRVYKIWFTATDQWGATATGFVKVVVSHDQSPALRCHAIDSGYLYDATATN